MTSLSTTLLNLNYHQLFKYQVTVKDPTDHFALNRHFCNYHSYTAKLWSHFSIISRYSLFFSVYYRLYRWLWLYFLSCLCSTLCVTHSLSHPSYMPFNINRNNKVLPKQRVRWLKMIPKQPGLFTHNYIHFLISSQWWSGFARKYFIIWKVCEWQWGSSDCTIWNSCSWDEQVGGADDREAESIGGPTGCQAGRGRETQTGVDA